MSSECSLTAFLESCLFPAETRHPTCHGRGRLIALVTRGVFPGAVVSLWDHWGWRSGRDEYWLRRRDSLSSVFTALLPSQSGLGLKNNYRHCCVAHARHIVEGCLCTPATENCNDVLFRLVDQANFPARCCLRWIICGRCTFTRYWMGLALLNWHKSRYFLF